ncbi:MAG: outer membrane lipoprotein-sorting protein [Gammaproteobacteria bacterium]|jgi:outer membrane lipoprotein-sorting protein|nr:outer membrane lipoprotein-sorting protein [Gammaproteobacteria bacterium]MDP6733350.1 outer membrane lipoprotein-sorting protein [Gammaproteobacteria bacterium]
MNYHIASKLEALVNRVSQYRIWPAFLLISFHSSLALGADSAIEIIDQMEALYQGVSSSATMTMIVETPQYQRTMEMQANSMGTENTFIRILSPRKDRGIATLKLDMEMWNYLPKINKVIKVPPSMMMGSWMGSDFTNDDLVKQTTLTKEYFLTLEETDELYTIILVPKEETVTVWGKIDYVVDKQYMVPVGQNFYDDRGELVRKLEFSELKEFSGKMIPSRLEMIPMNKEGHKTIVIYDDLQFSPPDVDESIFTLRNLRSRF